MRSLTHYHYRATKNDASTRRKGFRPLNTLASPQKPRFFDCNVASFKDPLDALHTTPLSDDEKSGSPDWWAQGKSSRMVKERSPSRTSSTQSPQKQERKPLANISAKIQSPSPKQASQDNMSGDRVKPPAQPEFGKPSPLRNPLQRPEPSIFMPKKKPVQRSASWQRPTGSPQFQQAQGGPSAAPSWSPTEPRAFYLPGQRPTAPAQTPQYSSALEAAQAYASQPFKRTFEAGPEPVQLSRPANAPLPTIAARPPPTFSSIPPNTYYQPFVPPKPVVDLTKDADGDDDTFDPDAAIRTETGTFGAPDPYMYVDSAQASENIKNLLEGAFDDDDDKSKTRLRKRAKRALDEGKVKEAKGLSAKLEALSVKEDDQKKSTEEVVEEEEEDDGTVEGLKVKLLPHQVEGVAWMIDKEIGVRKKPGALPFGGILADDMGLGKTVQSISLILTNSRPASDAKPEHKNQKMPGKEVGKGTLVVAPLALIKQWEDEIKTKVSKSHALRVLVHHGASRTKSFAELKKYDVVITTYQTLTSEHAGSNMSNPSGPHVGCFGVHWYRIILDEAHSIKNRNAKATQAAYALNSWYRWCLTGTPMQNNLDELQSLIRFLRVKPYSELPQWKQSITGPMKSGRGGLAMRRLQYFLKAIMKRRTKDILKKEGALDFGGKKRIEGDLDEGEKKSQGMQIVKREVETVECDFDAAEQQFYDRLQRRADDRLREIEKNGKQDYIGALVILLRLRQACNHPQLVEMAMNKDKDAMTTGQANGSQQTPRKQSRVEDGEMDDLAALMGGASIQTKQCDVCQADLSAAEAGVGMVRCGECEKDLAMMKEARSKSKVKKEKEKVLPKRARMRRVVVDSDDDDDDGEGEWIADGPEQHQDLGKAGGTDDEDAEGGGETLGSMDSEASRDSEEEDDEEDDDSDSRIPIIRGLGPSGKKHQPSSKIRRLLRILHAEIPDHKVIVFSQFTTMLDLIEPYLRTNKLRYVRYDGSMRPDAREASLHSLRTDPKCRILLCSLKCGSLGLNLTAASRVVIVEPFWNPFVEEQAIDRVHRLNQTVDVRVYRLTIRNTVEARILELQEKKRELAAAAIEGGKAVGKLSMQDILSLFRHDGDYTGPQDREDREWDRRFAGGAGRIIDLPGDDEGGVVGMRGFAKKSGRVRLGESEVYGRRW